MKKIKSQGSVICLKSFHKKVEKSDLKIRSMKYLSKTTQVIFTGILRNVFHYFLLRSFLGVIKVLDIFSWLLAKSWPSLRSRIK